MGAMMPMMEIGDTSLITITNLDELITPFPLDGRVSSSETVPMALTRALRRDFQKGSLYERRSNLAIR